MKQSLLSPSEQLIICAFLQGESPELNVLLRQFRWLNSICTASEKSEQSGIRRLLKPLRTGSPQRFIEREGSTLNLKIPTGISADDYSLGDRRVFTLDDVVGITKNGAKLVFGLTIAYGVLCQLKIIGELHGAYIITNPTLTFTRDLGIVSTAYIKKHGVDLSSYELTAVRQRRNYEHLSPPLAIANPLPWQAWFLSLDKLQLAKLNREFSLQIRRCSPGSCTEIDEFEERFRIGLPQEIRYFWSVTNGASYLGAALYGTYDARVIDSIDGKKLVLSDDICGEGRFLVIDVVEAGVPKPESGPAYVIDSYTTQTILKWGSLREYLESVSKECCAIVPCVVAQDAVKEEKPNEGRE